VAFSVAVGMVVCCQHERTHRVEDVLKVGDSIDVRVIDIDVVGRVCSAQFWLCWGVLFCGADGCLDAFGAGQSVTQDSHARTSTFSSTAILVIVTGEWKRESTISAPQAIWASR
jgi:hypothetical protein